MNTTEQDIRLSILNSLLTTPHKDLSKIYDLHSNFIKQDPLFYQQLAAWYFNNGSVRDHADAFIINLCVSDFDGHRDVGLAMLRELPPFRLTRVVDFIRKNLKRNIPRSIKTEITRYLRERENQHDWFDSTVLRARKHIKSLYATFKIPHSERVNRILFENDPPSDSILYVTKLLSQESDPTKQAQILIENKVPYTIASSMMKNMTPAVMFALVTSMSDQELINNIGSLTKRGALNNPEIKELVETRLKKAKTSKNVAALKSMEAVKNIKNLDADIQNSLENVADSQVKQQGRISRNTALLIDTSLSMTNAIEIGKQLAALISSSMDENANFYCYAFDSIPMQIKSKGTDLASWTKAMQGISASGQTNCGGPLKAMEHFKQSVEQIIIVTDEGDNGNPLFHVALDRYVENMKIEAPAIHIVRCGTRNSWGYMVRNLTGRTNRPVYEVDTYDIASSSDYYSLPNLIKFLSKPSKLDLLIEIMNYELPQRKKPVLQATS